MQISVKALLLGLGTWILTFLFLILTIGLSIVIPRSSGSTSFLVTHPDFMTVVVIVALSLALIFTGFITARISKRNELLHGLLIGIIVCIITYVFFSFFFKIIMKTPMSPEYIRTTISAIIILTGGIAGAFIQKRIKDKKDKIEPLEDKIDKLGE